MKWVTRSNMGSQRPPSAWLIKRFIDTDAEFLFFPSDVALAEAAKLGARTFHVTGAEFNKDPEKQRTTFDQLLDGHGLRGKDAGLDRMAEILNPACGRPETAGVRAINAGFRQTHFPDLERLPHLMEVYESLYRWCVRAVKKEQEAASKPAPETK